MHLLNLTNLIGRDVLYYSISWADLKPRSLVLVISLALILVLTFGLVPPLIDNDEKSSLIQDDMQTPGSPEIPEEKIESRQQPRPPSTEILPINNVTIHFIDVGQGDATLIDTNGRDVLIDGGTRSKGDLVTQYLEDQNITTLDIVIGTHPHADHIGGLIGVISAFDLKKQTVKTVLDSGYTKETRTYRDYFFLSTQRNLTIVERGMVIQLDDITRITVMNPVQPLEFSDANDNSIVILLEIGNVSFWLSADCETKCEQSIMAAGLVRDIDILKVGHHGSRTSSSSEFIRYTNPEVSIISAGLNNQYGHPHEEAVIRLGNISSTLYRTDIQGTITISTNGTGYSISTHLVPIMETPSITQPPTQPPSPPKPPEPPEPPPIEEAKLVINEVEQNPEGIDAGNEWLEIYNPSSKTVDLRNWRIVTTHGKTMTYTFQSTTIAPGEYLVIQFTSGQFIDNEDERIILFDSSGREIDRTPILTDTRNDQRSWQRKLDGLDTDSRADWIFRNETRGKSNAS